MDYNSTQTPKELLLGSFFPLSFPYNLGKRNSQSNCIAAGEFRKEYFAFLIKPIYHFTKNHTCEEGGTCLRISFWHLLMEFEKPQKSEFWKKWKKNCWKYHHFTHVYQKSKSYKVQFMIYKVRQFFCSFRAISALSAIKIISCMVSEIWSVNGKAFVILGHFLPFDPPNNPKNQNFEKLTKTSGDIIIFHLCTTNDDHMMYGNWDIKHDKQNFWSFWTIFCPFTSANNPENQNFEKMKKTPGRYYHFPHEHHKSKSYDIWFLRYEARQIQFFLCPFTHHPPSPRLTTQRIKILKNEKP